MAVSAASAPIATTELFRLERRVNLVPGRSISYWNLSVGGLILFLRWLGESQNVF